MKVVILGGLGFIGKNLYEIYKEFRDPGDRIYLIDHDQSNMFDALEKVFLNFKSHKNDNIFLCDLNDYEQFEKWMDEIYRVEGNIDILYNFAATVGVEEVSKNPLVAFTNNIEITKNIVKYFEIKQDIPTIVHASTSEVYGEDSSITESFKFHIDTSKPQTLYAVSKIANEAMLASLKSKTHVIMLRYFNISGKHQKRGVMYEMTQDMLRNSSCRVNSKAFRNFMNVEAAVYATYLIAHNKDLLTDRFKTFNIGSLRAENYISMRELSTVIKDVLKLTDIQIEEINNPEIHWITSRNVFPIMLERFICDIGKQEEFQKRDIAVKEIVQKMLPNNI